MGKDALRDPKDPARKVSPAQAVMLRDLCTWIEMRHRFDVHRGTLSALHDRGLVEYTTTGYVRVTDAGRERYRRLVAVGQV